MSKVAVNESSLQDIADAIRTKNGSSTTYKPSQMKQAILNIPTSTNNPLAVTSNGTYTAPEGTGYSPVTVNVPQEGAPSQQDLTFSGNCSYLFYSGKLDWFLNKYGRQMVFNNIDGLSNTFNGTKIQDLSYLTINCSSTNSCSLANCFNSSTYLRQLPKILNIHPYTFSSLFNSCYYLRNIPDDYFDTWVMDYTSSFSCTNIFPYCYSLRKIPETFFNKLEELNPYSGTNSNYFYLSYLCTQCYVLDELTNVTFNSAWRGTSNCMGSIVNYCSRLKDFKFKMNQDGTPKVGLFKNQVFDFSSYTGWSQHEPYITGYNSGITSAKKVYDATSYNLLKNDPDWYTTDVNYSRYNHDSAVNTINTLPDCHAAGTNTIKFKGQAGALTDGGAINTLTDAEIAVAAAKGWTVTFA